MLTSIMTVTESTVNNAGCCECFGIEYVCTCKCK